MAANNTGGDDAEGPGPSKRGRTSYVWEYFTLDADGKTVECKLCKRKLKYNSNTSIMSNHLAGKHPVPKPVDSSAATAAAATAPRQTRIGEYAQRPFTEQRRKKITELVVNFVVKDCRPIAAVSGEGFREVVNFLEPNYTIPCHATVWKTINLQYNTLRAAIAKEMWTSCTMDPYITVTAHYITDSFEIKSKVLRTTIMRPSAGFIVDFFV